MFDLMPFERRTRNLSNFFDAFDKTFFSDFPASFSEIRTDILDQGDKFLLQAELPGFDKEDIKMTSTATPFRSPPSTRPRARRRRRTATSAANAATAPSRAASTSPASTSKKSAPRIKTACSNSSCPRRCPPGRRPARSSSNKPPGFWNPPSASAGGGFRIPVQIFSRIRLFRREFML